MQLRSNGPDLTINITVPQVILGRCKERKCSLGLRNDCEYLAFFLKTNRQTLSSLSREDASFVGRAPALLPLSPLLLLNPSIQTLLSPLLTVFIKPAAPRPKGEPYTSDEGGEATRAAVRDR